MAQVNVEGFFYGERHARTIHSARTVLSLVARQFGVPKSVLDVGCGVGTWLFAARELGAAAVHGVEGPWLNDVETLAVERSDIEIRNLEEAWTVPAGFDLALSLEVAEHLTPSSGVRLVEQLCRASSLVLFSAALPGQDGNGHINEQWPSYWQERFARHGYRALDCIRPAIWSDESIPYWYRQNILVFADGEKARDYYLTRAATGPGQDAPLLGARVQLPRQSLGQRVVRKIRRTFRR